MIDWNKLIENGKKCGVDYHFYDDVELKKCSCGGKARIYSKVNKDKNFSFGHLHIKCENCGKSISDVYDMSGNPSEYYRPKDEVIERNKKEWNENRFKENRFNSKIKGIFSGNQNAEKYNWNMPGKPKNQ